MEYLALPVMILSAWGLVSLYTYLFPKGINKKIIQDIFLFISVIGCVIIFMPMFMFGAKHIYQAFSHVLKDSNYIVGFYEEIVVGLNMIFCPLIFFFLLNKAVVFFIK